MHVGDRVTKTTGDYTFTGTVVASFPKRSGETRVVVENDDGILHIFNPKQLAAVHGTAGPGTLPLTNVTLDDARDLAYQAAKDPESVPAGDLARVARGLVMVIDGDGLRR